MKGMIGRLRGGDAMNARQLLCAGPNRVLRVGVWAVAIACAGQTAARGEAAAQLREETASAFERYVKQIEARNEEDLRAGKPALWVDGLEENERAEEYVALRRGEVRMKKTEPRTDGEKFACPHGMIHHWTGAVFLPGVELKTVLGVLQDYDNHSRYYAPEVERSRIEGHDKDHYQVYLRFRQHKVITVVLNTEHDVRYYTDSATRAHSRSSAVRIAQVENAGRNDEREKPAGDDDGFLWRMETWWRMEERDGGVYLQSEVVSLTRDVLSGLGWLIGPFVNSVPRESLTFTLEATRRAVEARTKTAERPSDGSQEPHSN